MPGDARRERLRVERFVRDAFTDRIAFVAARQLLSDSVELLPPGEVRERVTHFLESHPLPSTK